MMKTNVIINADALEGLKELPNESVNCCVTSPPYYYLRDYGHAGQLGLEETPEKFIENLTAIFREVKRVLKKDGTLWVVIGDSYAKKSNPFSIPPEGSNTIQVGNKGSYVSSSIVVKKKLTCKEKDLIGVPWMLAFALRNEGFYLRSDIIWNKPTCMPERVEDRCTRSHEYIFMLSKSKKYYFDNEAILEKAAAHKELKKKGKLIEGNGEVTLKNGREKYRIRNGVCVRSKRDVWTISPTGYKGKHYATFPKELVKYCVLAGCPENGVVLDPFMGSGTTALVARELNRNYIGIEINADNVTIAEERIRA